MKFLIHLTASISLNYCRREMGTESTKNASSPHSEKVLELCFLRQRGQVDLGCPPTTAPFLESLLPRSLYWSSGEKLA